MGIERDVNVVISEKLYLESMVERDLFSDEQEMILVDGKILLTSENSRWKNRKEFLQTQINKKKELLKTISDKF